MFHQSHQRFQSPHAGRVGQPKRRLVHDGDSAGTSRGSLVNHVFAIHAVLPWNAPSSDRPTPHAAFESCMCRRNQKKPLPHEKRATQSLILKSSSQNIPKLNLAAFDAASKSRLASLFSETRWLAPKASADAVPAASADTVCPPRAPCLLACIGELLAKLVFPDAAHVGCLSGFLA